MTTLNKWHHITNEGDQHTTYTHDSWIVPEEGSDIWGTCWRRLQEIKPYGDNCHVYVGGILYHCDQLMQKLDQLKTTNDLWGIVGVTPTREQLINGKWQKVEYKSCTQWKP